MCLENSDPFSRWTHRKTEELGALKLLRRKFAGIASAASSELRLTYVEVPTGGPRTVDIEKRTLAAKEQLQHKQNLAEETAFNVTKDGRSILVLWRSAKPAQPNAASTPEPRGLQDLHQAEEDGHWV